MVIFEDIEDIRADLKARKQQGQTIGFVPTMGALHQGHLSLVKLAREKTDVVVVSVFVNPMQFNSVEDLKSYPRAIDRDMKAVEEEGVDVLFMPREEDLYPNGADCGEEFARSCRISPGDRSWVLEGVSRPGHFEGVVTVVSLLFNIVQPDAAFFGQKDYQQARVIEQLVYDLHFPIQIVIGPTVREKDGLAMSSRNEKLSLLGRKHALSLSRSLFAAQDLAASGERNAARIKGGIISTLTSVPDLEVDYVEIVDANTLEPILYLEHTAQVLASVFVESVRLIDNVCLEVRS